MKLDKQNKSMDNDF